MSDEWLELANINFDKVIMHGRITEGFDEFRVRREREIEQVLTDAQKQAVNDLQIKHNDQMRKLLRSFIAEAS